MIDLLASFLEKGTVQMLFGIAGVGFILLSIIRKLGNWIELTNFFQRFLMFVFGLTFLAFSVLGAAENKEKGAIKKYYDKVFVTKKPDPEPLPEPLPPNPPAPKPKDPPPPSKPKPVVSQPKGESEQGYFSLGSTNKQVLSVMGQPNQIIGSGTYYHWYYGHASIDFENDRVVSFNNYEGRLKIKMD